MYGSRISLISKRNIRYVGILNEVNEVEMTISLEQVCSMGTEGRIGNPMEEIPPSSDVYEYIQFRATDVLSVQPESELPPPPQDPAILEARSRPRDSAPVPVSPQAASYSAQQGPSHAAGSLHASTAAATTAAPARTASDSATQGESGGRHYQQPSYAVDGEDQQHRSGARGGYAPRGGRGGFVPRGGAPNRRGGYQGRGGYQARPGGGRQVEVPESDFDFESSNSKLNKDDLAKEFAKLKVQVTDSASASASSAASSAPAGPSSSSSLPSGSASGTGAYTKKSFFDDISCEAKERMQLQEFGLSYEERRSRAHAERQQNYQTFGQATSDQAQLRYNRYQSGRGRGGVGAPGGYYHNNMNPNYNAGDGPSGWRGGRGGGRGGYHRGAYNGHRPQQQRDKPAAGTAAETST